MLNIRFLHLLPLFVPDLARYSRYHLTQHVCTASDTTEAVRVEKNGNYVLQQLGQVVGGESLPHAAHGSDFIRYQLEIFVLFSLWSLEVLCSHFYVARATSRIQVHFFYTAHLLCAVKWYAEA